jgi:hypothetical protein
MGLLIYIMYLSKARQRAAANTKNNGAGSPCDVEVGRWYIVASDGISNIGKAYCLQNLQCM